MSQGFVNPNNIPLPLSVVNGGTGVSTSTGTGSVVLNTNPSLITPLITTALKDVNGNSILGLVAAISSVNFLAIANGATGNAVGMSATGADTDVIMSLAGKGTGRVQIQGTGIASSVSPGFVGEFVSSVIPVASAISLSTTVAANVTSISLTAGDWDVWGNLFFAVGGACTANQGWISSTSATLPDNSLITLLQGTALTTQGVPVPQLRFLINTTTTIYLSARALFTTSTVTASGGIYARRRS